MNEMLTNVLWIGGAPDSGKTTVAQIIAEWRGLQLYNYDRSDVSHHERLAQTISYHRDFLNASLEDNWVRPEPNCLAERTLRSFKDRFPLVVEELVALPKEPMVIAEGFGFTPELIYPALTSKRQAVWLTPTESFKHTSMQRRNKPSFRNKTSDPDRATRNLFQRDMLLAEKIKTQTLAWDLTLVEVDGSRSIIEMVTLIEGHFRPYLLAHKQ